MTLPPSDHTDILLADYAMTRDDDRHGGTALLSAAGLAIALLGAMLALTGSECRLRGEDLSANAAAASKAEPPQCFALPELALAATPLLPLAVLSLIVIIGTLNVVRSYYLRALEAELRDKMSNPHFRSTPGLRPVSFSEVTLSLNSGTRGRGTYIVLAAILTGTCAVVYGGLSIYIATRLERPYQIAMAILYIPLWMLVIREGFVANFGGRSLIRRAIRQIEAQYSVDNPTGSSVANIYDSSTPTQRSLTSYLMFPRPEEASKILLLPAAFGIAILIPGNLEAVSWTAVGAAAACWVALDYFAYQARYQLNDIRGLVDDELHPDRSTRRRLPASGSSMNAAVYASLAVAGVRFLLACALIYFIDLGIANLYFGLALVTLIVVTAAYERIRSYSTTTSKTIHAMIWILAGGGYAIRGGLGFALAFPTPSTTEWMQVALAFTSFWASGVLLVTICWALDAVGNLTQSPTGASYYDSQGSLSRRGHVRALLTMIPIIATARDARIPPSHRLNWARPIAQRTKYLAPWNLAFVIALPASVLSVYPLAQLPWQALLLTTAVLLALGFATTFISEALILPYAAACTIASALLTWILVSPNRILPASAMALVCSAINSLFRLMSDRDVKGATDRFISLSKSAAGAILRLVVGQTTFNRIRP